MSVSWRRKWLLDLWREARRVLTPAHLAALLMALLLGREEILHSMGVSAEALFDGAALLSPLVLVVYAPQTLLSSVRHRSLELIAATQTGLVPVLRLRLTALYGWYGLLLLALLTPAGAAQGASYLLYWASMLVDGLFFMTAAVVAAHHSRSEAAGALAGIAFWVACSLLGKAPPPGMPWLSRMVPLGPRLWWPWTVILANRTFYLAASLVLLWRESRNMESAGTLLR